MMKMVNGFLDFQKRGREEYEQGNQSAQLAEMKSALKKQDKELKTTKLDHKE